ncbi:MAG: hypothetical protein Q9195_004976 [Heterodermia aff. obscurata]
MFLTWLFDQLSGLISALQQIHTLGPVRGQDGGDLAGRTSIGFHHDLKPSNILLFGKDTWEDQNLKISDFGSGRIGQVTLGSGETIYNSNPSTGDPNYSAPEFAVDGRTSCPKDVWSMGCVFLEVLLWALGLAKNPDEFKYDRMVVPDVSSDRDAMFWYIDGDGVPQLKPAVTSSTEMEGAFQPNGDVEKSLSTSQDFNYTPAPGLEGIINKFCPNLETFEKSYYDLHRNPELSGQEHDTAIVAANHLKGLGLKVLTGIGGHGLVGILVNGKGRTIMLRSELDALPLLEQTGLPYKSTKSMKDDAGKTKPVMHACGHDLHIACLMACSTLLHSAKACWKGTAIFLFQPGEETAAGAQAMVDAGLYDLVPKPDVLLAQHVVPRRAGKVSISPGPVLPAADSISIRIFGRGGHGGSPQNCVDPVMLAGYIIVRLQSIVSRETPPAETVVISCGSIHGGDAPNVIPDYVDLDLNIRTRTLAVRKQVLASIRRIVEGECETSRAPQKPTFKGLSRFPPTSNDKDLTEALSTSFRNYFGDEFGEHSSGTASEDVSNLATPLGIPYAYWTLGCIDPAKWDTAKERNQLELIPGNHSPFFAPVVEPTLRTGTKAFALAALTFLT